MDIMEVTFKLTKLRFALNYRLDNSTARIFTPKFRVCFKLTYLNRLQLQVILAKLKTIQNSAASRSVQRNCVRWLLTRSSARMNTCIITCDKNPLVTDTERK